jgi:hypothetical protein
MIKFLLWCVLFLLCWPLALLALVLYPLVWLILLPFRIAGIAVHGLDHFAGAAASGYLSSGARAAGQGCA